MDGRTAYAKHLLRSDMPLPLDLVAELTEDGVLIGDLEQEVENEVR